MFGVVFEGHPFLKRLLLPESSTTNPLLKNFKGEAKGSDVKEMEMRLAGGDVALEGDDSDDDAAYAPIQWLADNTQEPTARIASNEVDALQGPKLDQALMALDERSRNIVQSRWLAMDAEGNGTKTLHDLADEYGISAERVRQIETAALKKMRGLLQAA